MIDTGIALLGTAGASLITGFCSWFFTRRQYTEGVNGQKIQNFDAAINAYKNMYEDMIADLKEQVDELKNENISLKEELSENRKQVITLTNFVLASALQRADNQLSPDMITNLKKIVE